MTSNAWAMMLGIAMQALLFHAMPRFSRPDILFAVTVPEAFASCGGRTLVARYRAIVWTGAAAAVAASLLIPAPPVSERGAFLTMAVVAGNMIRSCSAARCYHPASVGVATGDMAAEQPLAAEALAGLLQE